MLGILTNPAAETKSIGLPADAQVVMVFARHLLCCKTRLQTNISQI